VCRVTCLQRVQNAVAVNREALAPKRNEAPRVLHPVDGRAHVRQAGVPDQQRDDRWQPQRRRVLGAGLRGVQVASSRKCAGSVCQRYLRRHASVYERG
jgi:hypothetical protein